MAEAMPSPAPSHRRRWLVIGAVWLVGLVVLAMVFYFGVVWRVNSGMKPTFIKSSEPFSLEEARRLSGLPIPETAREIRYARYTEFIALTEVLRFEAPIDDCKAFAEAVLADYARGHPGRTLEGLRPFPAGGRRLTGSEAPPAATMLEPLDAAWFTPGSIRSGMLAGERGSHQPMIWIDIEKGVLYFLLTD